jgi:hypothetical protein
MKLPFLSRTHWITIVLVTFAFVLFRLAGGYLYIRSARELSSPVQENNGFLPFRGEVSNSDGQQDELRDQLLEQIQGSTVVNTPAPEEETSSESDLSEIEKEIGLE